MCQASNPGPNVVVHLCLPVECLGVVGLQAQRSLALRQHILCMCPGLCRAPCTSTWLLSESRKLPGTYR